jgi:enoyl-CoA hydratase/carnithine racemase
MPAIPASARSSFRPGFVAPEAIVRIEDAPPIRELVLDQPSRKNALTISVYRALTAALAQAASDDRLLVVILSSSSGPFCVGNDFAALLEGSVGAYDGREFVAAAGRFLRTLASFPKPIIAAVGGIAAGAGATLLLHCDMIVASHGAAFDFPSTRLGILPDAGSSVLLPARVGLQRATEWLLFGDRIDVQTAEHLGFVNAVVPRNELSSTVMARADAIARLPQSTVRDTKRLLREPLRQAVEEAIERELETIRASLEAH